ncbi:hypothetical protein BDQ17DRAFT_1421858 [Cyathus striatus]|nr:hypothetical protein BDQ17DRAFT_1421858 [Cyathus striatus]
MPSTRGRYRWIGLRKEGDIEDDIRMDSRLFEFSQMDPQRVDSHPESIKPQEEELLSPSPMPPIGLTSEAEWEAWERARGRGRRRKGAGVIQEVNAAQDNSSLTKVNENSPLKPSISKEPTLLVTNDTSSNAVPKVQGSLTLTSSADLLANRAPLGFAVVKRGSKNTVGNGKPKATVSKDTIIVDDSLKEKDDTSQASSKGKAREASIPVQRSGSKPPSKGRPQSKPSSRAQSQPPSKSLPLHP